MPYSKLQPSGLSGIGVVRMNLLGACENEWARERAK